MESLLAQRINERLEAVGLSPRKASLRAGQSADFIRNIFRGRSQRPSGEALAALARVLDCPLEYLTEVADDIPQASPRAALGLGTVFVRGYVQGGVWRDAMEWDSSSWYAITAPGDDRFPGLERFGLEVRGPSMNLLYPEGTVVICVRYDDLARRPLPGEKVICLRRARTGEFEATIKEYQQDETGRHVLWPRSTDPEFQQPIVLNVPELPIGMPAAADMPVRVAAGHLTDTAGAADLQIVARVIQSVRRE